MLFLSVIISLGLSLLLASAQQRRCPPNEVWSYPIDGCNTCVPELFCETRQEFGCNCRSGYTREIFTGRCISRLLCPLAPATVSTITSTHSTMKPNTTTMESTTTPMEPTTTTMEPTTTTMEPTTTTMEPTITSKEPTTTTMEPTTTTKEPTTTTMGSNSTAT